MFHGPPNVEDVQYVWDLSYLLVQILQKYIIWFSYN